ncbi:hypothetical protein H0H87_000280 [Tephrocybe sp. NHM501043]|nr:hypothetical protein H0H87_000280 [Tephrocybe sp. NHM501043]
MVLVSPRPAMILAVLLFGLSTPLLAAAASLSIAPPSQPNLAPKVLTISNGIIMPDGFNQSLSHLSHLRAQMANILHSVSNTMPTCACGEQARGCAIRALECFIYGSERLHDDHEKDDFERRMRDHIHRHEDPNLGPLIGAKRRFRTHELVPSSGGLDGIVVWLHNDEDEDEDERRMTREENVDEEETEDELELHPGLTYNVAPNPRKHYPSLHRAGPNRIDMPRGRPLDPPVDVQHAASAAVPPKMRKGWMKQAARNVDMASQEDKD